VAFFKVLPQNWSRGAEENFENTQSGQAVFRPRFDTGIIRLRTRNVDSYYYYYYYYYYYLVCEAIGTATTPGLLYQPRVIVKMIV
jgi:hypothetical protein